MNETTDNTEESVILSYNNLKWNDADHTSFDVMIEHRELGWLPYTCSAIDTGCGKVIWEDRANLSIAEYTAPVRVLADVIADKLNTVSHIANKFEQSECPNVFITSSVNGLVINADRRSQQNLQGLIAIGNENILFKCYDNTFTTVSKANLETMLLECYINGTTLYQQKFAMQTAISALTTVEEVDNYQVVFDMMNFYNQ